MLQPLDDFKPADLPERKLGFWKMAGPGAILVGLSIGAGEIIIWPRIVAEHGGTMIWAAVVGVFLQLWINLEVGRWTIATGETVYTGYSRVWRGFAFVFILLTILGWLAPGWAMASGFALRSLLSEVVPGAQETFAGGIFASATFWTGITFAGVAAFLFGPKVAYQGVEKTIEVLVLIITVGLIAVAIKVGTAKTWEQMGEGLANAATFKIAEGMDRKAFFIALVFAGAGGTANLFYTFYLRDKQIGMGGRVPAILNPLRGRQEAIPATGFKYEENAENASRFRAWWRYVKQDQALFFFGLNTLTILLFIFGALAVLYPDRNVPAEGTLIRDQAEVLGKVWGTTGRVLFLLIGMATLYSTQLALVDGVARSLSDIVYTNFAFARKRGLGWWYMVIAGSWMTVGTVLVAVLEHLGKGGNLGVLFSAAYMGGFAMALYVPLTLYMNLRYLPRSARPGPFNIGMMVLASLVYGGFAISCIVWELQ